MTQRQLSKLSGWRLQVFKVVEDLNKEFFDLEDLYAYESDLKIVYPNNNHILDKIRQQLQELRDLGLIEFLGEGNYKRLF